MLNLISITNEAVNNVAYVETDCGKVYGIVNAFHVTDESGLKLEGDFCSVLEWCTDIDKDWDNEANIIHFIEANGESSALSVDIDGFSLVDGNE
jgi:hypothetical protein